MNRINSKFLNLGVFSLLLIVILITACEKDVGINKATDYEAEILKFQDNQKLQEQIDEINLMSSDDYNNWQESQNFVSLRTKLDNIYHRFDDEKNASNEDFVYKIVEENNKWIELVTDEYGEKCVYPRVQDKEYASILNADGICMVGNKILKIIGDYKILAPKSELIDIINTYSVEDAEKNPNWEINQYKYTISRSLKSTDEWELRGSTTYKKSSCGQARRCFIEMVLIHDDYGYLHRVSLRTRLTSERKYACIWVHYWTHLWAENVSCSARVWSEDNGRYYSGNISPFSMDSGGDVWDTQTTKEIFEFYDAYPQNSSPEFLSAHGEASSRGVNGQWAIINYTK